MTKKTTTGSNGGISPVMEEGDLQILCGQEQIDMRRHIRFADDEIADGGNDIPHIKDGHFVRCDFDNVGLKRAVFEGGSLTKCRFIDAYMRRTRFDGVDLTGTLFVRCNLKYASFDRCDLRYVEFRECTVDYENILRNSPKEVNLKRSLLHGLRMNAVSLGELRMANRLFLLEMEAMRTEEMHIMRGASKYFREKYTGFNRFKATVRLLGHYAELVLWGYGLRMTALFRTAAIAIILATVLISSSGTRFLTVGINTDPRSLGFLESLYVSTVTFATLGYGDYAPVDVFGRIVMSAEAVSGAIFLGFLAAAAYRRIAR